MCCLCFLAVKWEGSSKTTGLFKVGYQHKSFDSARKSFSSSTCYLGTFGIFFIYSTRAAEDADSNNKNVDYVKKLSTSLVWEHDWSEKFNSNLQVIYTNEDYVGGSRVDDKTSETVDLNYDFTRWFRVTAGYEFTTKDSNSQNVSYDENAVNLGVNIAL